MPLYLGLDSSTQSLTAIVVDADKRRRAVVFESSLQFDRELPQYGTRHGVLPHDDPSIAWSPPRMWADALDIMLGRVAKSGLDLSKLAAVSGSAQQHGSVYIGAGATDRPPFVFSRAVAPIWMDCSTTVECAEITAAVGGSEVLAAHTGSRAFERFTGPQIRKFYKTEPAAYAATERIHLVSSYLASLLIGDHAPVDPGDGSGMNLMDLATTQWWPEALAATAPDLADKLPDIVPSSTVVGALSPHWRQRHGLPAAAVVAWSGDNPCSLVGTGLVREGIVAISLGTSDTIFGLMREPRVNPAGIGHVFGSPTGDYMGITVFRNGSLARERVRDDFKLSWDGFSRALDQTPPGNNGRMLLPWFEPEITPPVARPGVRRFDLDPSDAAANVRAIVEAQMMAMALHSRWMGVDVKTIHATGGASANRAILQVMADVFGADVYQFDVGNSACLGAALRAFHAHRLASGDPVSWDEVVQGRAEPVTATRVSPNPSSHAVYLRMLEQYAERERDAARSVRL
ncbi:MAG TPA: FGGY-family carbohydrate kinase [Vicinamibacterales bacterium]|nr:FGGY-family carbohydrate kinase [Vicinamibacterales bacterium]